MADTTTGWGVTLFGLLRSAAAILLGAVVVVGLSLSSDSLLQVTGVFPPVGEPIKSDGLLLLALAYRSVYGIMGSFITASAAPYAPMQHVWIGAGIGFLASLAGLVAAINMNFGPLWYPLALLATVLPGAWVGGRFHALRGN